jgi:hypothetical protein
VTVQGLDGRVFTLARDAIVDAWPADPAWRPGHWSFIRLKASRPDLPLLVNMSAGLLRAARRTPPPPRTGHSAGSPGDARVPVRSDRQSWTGAISDAA